MPSVGGGGEGAQRMKSRSKLADYYPGCKFRKLARQYLLKGLAMALSTKGKLEPPTRLIGLLKGCTTASHFDVAQRVQQ